MVCLYIGGLQGEGKKKKAWRDHRCWVSLLQKMMVMLIMTTTANAYSAFATDWLQIGYRLDETHLWYDSFFSVLLVFTLHTAPLASGLVTVGE